MFIKYSTGLISPKESRGKGSQGKKIADTPQTAVDVSEESDSEPARKRTGSRRVIKKKVLIFEDNNIIPEPNIALELGKSMSLIEAVEEEEARKVYATHERIVTESDPDSARRRPSGISFRDTSSVSKKMSPGLSQNLKGVQTLTPEEQLAANTMQALKANRKTSRSQSLTGGSSKGTGVSLGFLMSQQSSLLPQVKELSEYSEEDQGDDENIPWESTNEDEEKKDDDDADNDKSIDLEKTDDEETDDEFVHSEEYVQDDDEETDDELVHGDEKLNADEDEEMKNVKDADTRNGDEEITDAAKAD
ncbi:hypothetical protein Tco_0414513 [Tanacetum coccineum]